MPEEIQFLGGKILGRKTYTRENAPPVWQNEFPSFYSNLHISTSELPFVDPVQHEEYIKANVIDPTQLLGKSFPLIEDFEVTVWSILLGRDSQKQQLDYDIRFFSPSQGFLAAFSSLDYSIQDLCRDNFKIPC